MRVILKQDIENLGKKGDTVDVASGYGRNYLIPKKLAIKITPSNMKMIEIERQALKKTLEKERSSFQELIEKLNQTTLSFRRKAGEKDIIFGSVSSSDIKDALHELGFEIEKKKILLEDPIKRLGNYTVPIKIFHEDRAEVKIEVIKKEQEAEEDSKKGEEKDLRERTEEAEEARPEPEKGKEKEREKVQEEKKEEPEIALEEKMKEPEEEITKPEEGEEIQKEQEEEKTPEEKMEEVEAKSPESEGEEEEKGEEEKKKEEEKGEKPKK